VLISFSYALSAAAHKSDYNLTRIGSR